MLLTSSSALWWRTLLEQYQLCTQGRRLECRGRGGAAAAQEEPTAFQNVLNPLTAKSGICQRGAKPAEGANEAISLFTKIGA